MKNDKSVDGVFEYMFIDTGKIVGELGNNPPLMTNTVSVEIDLAKSISTETVFVINGGLFPNSPTIFPVSINIYSKTPSTLLSFFINLLTSDLFKFINQ